MKKEKKIYQSILFKICIILVVILLGTLCVIFFSKPKTSNNKIKYVFLFIGDGMSTTQTDLTEMYLNQLEDNKMDEQKQLSYTKFNTIGLRKNQSGNNYVTDSAASASVLASGKLINNYSLNIDKNGNKTKPITYKLKDKLKMKIGIVTTMGINHATPAGFYAYNENRTEYENIAYQIADTNFDYFAGGGILNNNDDITKKISDAGYKIISNQDNFNNMKKNNKYVVLSPYLNSVSTINFGMDQKEEEWGLDDLVKQGINVLDNKNGFFMMVEEGSIDYAGHNNDGRTVISEVLELDKAVNVAKEFADKHPDEVLIIVTGDHETGGLALGNTVNYKVFKDQKLSYVDLTDYGNKVVKEKISLNTVIEYITSNCKIDLTVGSDNYNKIVEAYNSLDFNPNALKETIIVMKNNEAGISYTTDNHTGVSIPIYVYGDKNNIFSGVYGSEEFNLRLQTLLNVK